MVIAAKLSTEDFDREITKMQQKLRDIYAPADNMRAQSQTSQRLQGVGMGGILSQPAMEAYQRATQQSRREMDQMIKEQAQGQERLSKIIAARSDKLKELKNQQQDMIRGSREELEIKQKIARVEENNFRLRENYRQRDDMLNQMIDAKEKAKPQGMDRLVQAYQGGGLGGAGRAGMRMIRQDPYGAAGVLGKGLGGVAGLGAGIAQQVDYLSGAPMRLEAARGTAIQSTTGQDLARTYAGKSPFESAWMQERGQAAGISKEKADITRELDAAKISIAAALILGGIATAAATFGGSAPISGSAIAMGVGMAGGGVALGAMDRTRERLMGMFSGEHKQKYEQLLAAQQATDFRSTLENLKEQDPRKKLGMEDFEKNYMRYAGVQRMLGLSNQQFYGKSGLLQRGVEAGFMPEQMMGMSQAILGAGGSARMGRQAQFGLQMERMGMTNAPQILGTLSGGLQAPQASMEATKKILIESFKIGLDSSEFSEENRRFTQAAAEIISKSGATGESDQDRMIKALGMFMGERTNQGVEAAKSAYERFQERGSQLGGRRGVLRLTEAQKDPLLGKFNTMDLTELLGARPDQLREDSSFLRSYATEAKTTPAELLKSIQKVNKSGRFMIPGRGAEVGRLSEKITDYMKQQGLSRTELMEKSRKGELPQDIDYSLGLIQRRGSQEERGGFNVRESEAQIGEFIGEGFPSGKGGTTGLVSSMLDKGVGRIEDIFNKEGAKGTQELIRTLDELSGELRKAAEGAKIFTEATTSSAARAGENTQQRRQSSTVGSPMLQDIANALYGPPPPASVQPQGDKNSK